MPAILFSSPKGGVGKTTLAAHVAAILARRGRRVIALDLDPQNALRLHFGLPMREEPGFMMELRNQPDWRDALVQTQHGVDLLPFGSSESGGAIRLHSALLSNPALLTDPVQDILRDPRTILIIDSPPGPSSTVASMAGLADLVVVVLLADAGSACLFPQLLSGQIFGSGTIGGWAAKRAGIVLNQVELDRRLPMAVLETATRLLGPRLLGAVGWDESLAEDLAKARMQLDREGGAARDLTILADMIEMRVVDSPAPPRAAAYPAFAEWGIA